MDWIKFFIDVFLHVNEHLDDILKNYGTWTYLILFVTIFCETGLVVTPFLPGDSLLFAAGALAARPGTLDVTWLFLLLTGAAIAGNTVNYSVAHFIGPRAFRGESRILKKEYLDRTHAFFEKYGGFTIIITRFVPIVRTFAPFVAGAGAMNYPRFFLYNVAGGLAWVAVCIFSGYGFGNQPFVKDHFSLVVVAIVIISVLPMVVEFFRARRERARVQPSADEP
jgi:membrane-associated protein